jgi:hypothetical protein
MAVELTTLALMPGQLVGGFEVKGSADSGFHPDQGYPPIAARALSTP